MATKCTFRTHLLIVLTCMGVLVLFSTFVVKSKYHSTHPHVRFDFKTPIFGLSGYGSNISLSLGRQIESKITQHENSDGNQELNELEEELIGLLKLASSENVSSNLNSSHRACDNDDQNRQFNRYLPSEPRLRLEQLIHRQNLRTPERYGNVLKDKQHVIHENHDVIIASALSPNHWHESYNLMLENIHTTVFPVLTNFSFVVYDLGLTEDENLMYKSKCRCTLLKFPFEKFPQHVSDLRCHAWKALVIHLLFPHANVLIWMDASIRYHNTANFLRVLEQTRERKMTLRNNVYRQDSTPQVTLPSMFQFFGDSPCVYQDLEVASAGWMAFGQSRLVWKAILQPMVACALQSECICPKPPRDVIQCPTKPVALGACHRFEQSLISIIIGKLFHDHYDFWVRDVRHVLFVKRFKYGSYEYYSR